MPKHAGRRGHGSGLDEDQRGLATRYLPMAESLANAYDSRQRIEREELKSAAYLALVEAARTFDPARKVNFATYARHRIRGALKDYARFVMSGRWRGEKHLRPVLQSLGYGSEEHGRVLGIKAEKPIGSELETLEDVQNWLERLPKTHSLACRLIYIGGRSQDEVAQLLGFSSSHLSRLHTEALSFLIDDVNPSRARQERSQAEKTK